MRSDDIRIIDVRNYVVSNAKGRSTGKWGIRFGTRLYPDYATPHPTRWNGMHGGSYLTPDEAEKLAAALQRAAAWARKLERNAPTT